MKELTLIKNFLYLAANLKKIPRQGWIDKLCIDKPESVADHTFSMSIMGMILSDSQNYNTEKIMKMILIHDLAESITGDITPENKEIQEKVTLEKNSMEKILSELPENLQKQYDALWIEYQTNDSNEAKFVHQIDKLEMALQAKIYSEEKNLRKKVLPFFESAKKEISDPDILKLFEQMYKK